MEAEIKNGQSRDTGNIGHETQKEAEQNRKLKKMSNTNPTKKTPKKLVNKPFHLKVLSGIAGKKRSIVI